MINGNDSILYWDGEPIACLTSNSIAETLSFINTCKRSRLGALSPIPVSNSYSLNFEAVLVTDLAMSWNELSLLMRNQEVGSWAMTGSNDTGFGFLSNLEITATTGEIIKFTGTIVGQGEILPLDFDQNVWYQNNDVYVDVADKYVLLS